MTISRAASAIFRRPSVPRPWPRFAWGTILNGRIYDRHAARRWKQWVGYGARAFLGGTLSLDSLTYRVYAAADYDDFLRRYLRVLFGWALDDLSKTGLSASSAVSAVLRAHVKECRQRKEKGHIHTVTTLGLTPAIRVDSCMLPQAIQVDCLESCDGSHADITLTIMGKPAVRLPESYWPSFSARVVVAIFAEKVGEMVDVSDVVERGNRQMHGIDRFVDIKTTGGTFRIQSEEAFLVAIGGARGLNYSTDLPPLRAGLHFNLSNNLWGTNFSMRNEGSLTYHFKVYRL